jgi:hypothetical protein
MQKLTRFFFSIVISVLISGVCSNLSAQNIESPQLKPLNWYKGNTHAHTLNSDGDSTPDEVVRWYRENLYNFLVLTDHNFLTKVDGLNALHAADEKFIVIQGEEVSDIFNQTPIHINGLNVERTVDPQGGKSTADVIQRNVDAIRGASGVPHINHPNFQWAITAEDLKEVQNYKLFEIFNGHQLVNNLGGGGKPGLEEIWDIILSSGKLVYGIAVDDAHQFKHFEDKGISRPGKGWVVVRAAKLSSKSILEAMETGDFYASTGVELVDYKVNSKSITISIREEKGSKYRVQFTGKDGKLLKESFETQAVYDFRGDELYVRAKIIESNGKFAWTQPVMFAKK